MKLETFFEKFDQFADAPNAVENMRALVLELAVTGNLVAQDNRDEPASSLLDSTEAQRAKLIAAKKIKSRPTSAVEPDEQPFDVPSSWAWARLSDVGYELGQKVPDKRFTYIDVGGIDSDKGCISDRVEELEPGDAPSRARKLVARGTVIYSTVRPYLLNIAIVDRDFDPEPIASTAFGILHPFAGINNRYLFYWLRSAPFTAYVQAGMKGMAYPAINDEKFYSGFISLPPLAEQKRIVAKVDELMALCDRLEAQQQEREMRHAALARASLARFADAPTPANLPFLFHPSYAISPADLRKSILTLAVQGKLVPQDPNDELPQIPSDGQTVGDSEWVSRLQLPDTWLWARFESLLAVLKNGFNGKPSKVVGKFKITRIETIARETVDLARVGYADDLPGDVVAKHAVLKGDILFSHINSEPHLGKTAICTIDDPTLVHGVNLLLLRPIAGIDYRYLNIALRELRAAGYFVSIAQRAVNQASINQKNLGKTPISIPPLAEQRRIVANVEQLMALVDALETQLAASCATAANLLSALVAELTSAHREKTSKGSGSVQPVEETKRSVKRPNRHFARAVLSAEIVHQLHTEPTFGRVKHQKIFHLCEHIAQIPEIEGEYHREAAGPLDNQLIYANEAELKRQQWFAETARPSYGHAYKPLAKAGNHRRYLEEFWKDKLPAITHLVELMRSWDTERCEIFSTAYAAWNDLLIWDREPKEEAILHEILERWNPAKKRFPRERWLAAIQWMRDQEFAPIGWGRATALPQ